MLCEIKDRETKRAVLNSVLFCFFGPSIYILLS